MRRLFALPAVFIALLALSWLATSRPGDPALYPAAPGATVTRIYLADHGYHASLVVPREDFGHIAQADGLRALVGVADKFRLYPFIEIGWGDEGIYRGATGIDLASAGVALKALFGPANPSVLHVVGLRDEPDAIFTASQVKPLDLSQAGAAKLARFLDATFALTPQGSIDELGRGLYGPSLFYRATPPYSLTRTCNHWVAEGLNMAGLGVSMFAATLSAGLRGDLAAREWAGR